MNRSKNRFRKVVSLILGAVLVLTTFGAATFADASAQADYSQSVKVKDVDGGTLTVTAKADNGVLPDDALLSVTPITGGSIYYDVADKVQEAASDDDKTVSGFLAYDISFFDGSGQSVEPSGNVNVSMDWDDSIRPAGADDDADVSVLHLKDSDNSVSSSKVVDLTDDTKAIDDTNTATVQTTGSEKSVTSADMTVNSFSIFTITWTKKNDSSDNSDAARIGSVRVRYVDENGLELDTSSDFSSEELGKMSQTDGGIVDLKDWADKSDGSSRVDGYTYDHATIGSRDGRKITGVKVEQSKETQRQRTDDGSGEATYQDVEVTIYRLYYTTDEVVNAQSKWTEYRDSGSETYADNANVYLFYTRGSGTKDPDRVTIHHVDKYGAQLAADTTDTFGFTRNGQSNISAFTDRWNGSSYNSTTKQSYYQQHTVPNIGTYEKSYIGALNGSEGSRGLFYRKDSSTGVWHTGTGDMGTDGSSVTTEITKNNNPVLYTNVYNVYSGYKGTTIHYIDEDGNKIAEDTGAATAENGTFTADSYANNAGLSGYTFKEARAGSEKGSVFTTITYTKNGDDWSSAVKNGSDNVNVDGPVNEVWLVYTKGVQTKELTIHYQYENKSGSYSDAYYGDDKANTTEKLIVRSGQDNYLVTDPNKYGAYVATIHDGDVRHPASDGESSDPSVIYMSSHLAESDGPIINYVDVGQDGKLIYYTSMNGTAEPDSNSSDPTSWTFSEADGAQRGRSIVISRDSSGNLNLNDSMNGDVALDLANDEAGDLSAGTHVGETYEATLHNESYTVEYTVTPYTYNRTSSDGTITQMTRYTVRVLDSYSSESTDIYQIYIDGDNNTDKLWIEDDMKYSGLFRAGLSDQLITDMRGATGISYRWHRITVDDSAKIPSEITDETNKNYETVLRKQSGEHWNIALDADKATWLDIEADEGTDVWTKGTTHAYYLELTYTPKNSSTAETIYSTPLTVNYYGRLENGSFEDPSVISGNANYVAPDHSSDYSNAKYREAGGVWQTTGPGETRSSNYSGEDIEIVNATNHNVLKNSYHWQNGNESQTSWAADGNQFAELNAENAGALYQDVITHPNESINFWLSHRARGSKEADNKNYKYDTMYVVIMPTKLAMTMGNAGTELRTQTELQNFINAHGGFDSDIATKEVSRLTYSDEDSGILIYKVSSDENDWHDISVINQYKAKGGLTRFFFCAASTAGDKGRNEVNNLSDPPTQGNFIDNVGFSQQLPPTKGFNLTVTETFSGLTMEELAGLASNAGGYADKGIVKQKNPLKITLTNSRSGNAGEHNDALYGAKLGFTISYDSDDNLVFTPTATKDGDSLLGTDASSGTSNVRQYSDGRIVITWAFPNQVLNETGNESQDQTYTYIANDNLYGDDNNPTTTSTTDVTGYSKTTSRNSVNNANGNTVQGTRTDGGISTTINKESDKTLNIINVYSPSVHISVRKTFSGITPSTVDEMMNGTGSSKGKQYAITITKGDATKVLKVDGGYTSDGEKDDTVSVSATQRSDGSTSYKWTVTDPAWQNGTYSVKEENYTTDRNTLSDIRINGQSVGTTWPAADQSVTIEDNTKADLNFRPTASQDNSGVISLSSGSLTDTRMTSNTNLVVGEYTLETKNASSESENSEGAESATTKSKRYLVWTDSEVGLITRRAIISQINSIWGESEAEQATAENTSFFTGDNAYIVSDGRIARMVDRQSASLTGTGNDDKWDKFYAAHMTDSTNSSYSDESEIRIGNEYAPKIRILKQSSAITEKNGSSTHEKLNGAVFRLYKKNDSVLNSKSYYIGDGWDNDSDKAKAFTTGGSEGDGIVSLPENLDTGVIYYLEEYKAPDGYRSVKDVPFKVQSDGTVVMLSRDNDNSVITTADSGDVSLEFVDPYYTFVISDPAGMVLPLTGGRGTWAYILIGGLLVAGASVLLYRRKKSMAVVDTDTRKETK